MQQQENPGFDHQPPVFGFCNVGIKQTEDAEGRRHSHSDFAHQQGEAGEVCQVGNQLGGQGSGRLAADRDFRIQMRIVRMPVVRRK